MTLTTHSREAWFPVATETDVPYGHLYICQLLDEELLLWRDSNGLIHTWRDLCPHRSIRLSIGRHMGNTVQCANHGWQFGAEGQCTFIPAYPESPQQASGVCVKRYKQQIVDGLIWVTLSASESPADVQPLFPASASPSRQVLRPLTVNADINRLMSELRQFTPGDDYSLVEETGHSLLFGTENHSGSLAFVCRPAGADRAVVYGVLAVDSNGKEITSLLQYYNEQLKALRDEIEK